MNIVVLIKQVPDTYSERRLRDADGVLDRDATDAVLDEINERAVEAALQLKEANDGSEVTVLTMGPDLQHANESKWDPLSFEIYPGGPGRTELEVSDDRRQLRLVLTVNQQSVLLEGGSLDYTPIVRIHRPEGRPVVGRLGERIELNP